MSVYRLWNVWLPTRMGSVYRLGQGRYTDIPQPGSQTRASRYTDMTPLGIPTLPFFSGETENCRGRSRQLTQNRRFAIIPTVRVTGATRPSHWCNFSELLVRPRRVAGMTRLSRWCDFSESLVRQCRPTGATFSPMSLSIETGAFLKSSHIWSKTVRTRAYPYYRSIRLPTFREKWEPESPVAVVDIDRSVSRPSAGNHPTPWQCPCPHSVYRHCRYPRVRPRTTTAGLGN